MSAQQEAGQAKTRDVFARMPSQIKSATGNTGAFSENSDDIRV